MQRTIPACCPPSESFGFIKLVTHCYLPKETTTYKKKICTMHRKVTLCRFQLHRKFLKWVVMDSNHRRQSQQIYSLPHLATLVTTLAICNYLFYKSDCKGSSFLRQSSIKSQRISTFNIYTQVRSLFSFLRTKSTTHRIIQSPKMRLHTPHALSVWA